MRVPVQDMTFVLRSAGERTLPAAGALLRDLVREAGGEPDRQVAIIAETPFPMAVRRTFEIGLEAQRPWVVALDADVLLLSDAIDRFGAMCACAGGSTFTIIALVLCRFYGGLCYKGMHCYPRRLLDRALKHAIAPEVAASLKPETAVVRAMEADGFGTTAGPVVFGIHDYEQWLRHVHVKMRLRGRRGWADQAAGKGSFFDDERAFVDGRAASDPDFLVASWGQCDGRDDHLSGRASSHYDWEQPNPDLERRMTAQGIAERSPWRADAHGYAERTIAAHDFARDQRTPDWIRERLGFERGTRHVLERIDLAGHQRGSTRTSELAEATTR